MRTAANLLRGSKILKELAHEASPTALHVVERSGDVIGTFKYHVTTDAARIDACDALLRRLSSSDLQQFVDCLQAAAAKDGVSKLRFEIDGGSNAALRDFLDIGFTHFKTEYLPAFYPGVPRFCYHVERAAGAKDS